MVPVPLLISIGSGTVIHRHLIDLYLYITCGENRTVHGINIIKNTKKCKFIGTGRIFKDVLVPVPVVRVKIVILALCWV